MGAVAQIEPVASVATRVDHGEGSNGDCERLLRGFRSIGLAFAGDDTRHVHLEGHRGDPPAAGCGTES